MTYSPIKRDSMPIPVEPAVISVALVSAASASDIPVYIPWKGPVKLVYAYTVTTVAEGDDAAVEIDLELDAAGGTEIGTITVAKNSSIGDLDEMTFSTESAGEGLSRDNSSKDQVNIEIDGDNSTATWQGMLYMYFEKQV